MRFPPISEEHRTPAQRKVAAEISAGPRGQLRGPFVPLIYSPELASRIQRLGEYLRFGTTIPNALIELAVLLVARNFKCANIWHSHRALALSAGLDSRIIADIACDRRPAALSDAETAVFDFCEELLNDVDVSDARLDRIVRIWGRQTAIELASLCGYYIMLALVLSTAKIPLPEGATPFDY